LKSDILHSEGYFVQCHDIRHEYYVHYFRLLFRLILHATIHSSSVLYVILLAEFYAAVITNLNTYLILY
jgi:hypothetical protein